MAQLKGKKKRQALLDRQENQCALCNDLLSGSKSSCYDERHNTFTCRSCAQFINVCRSMFARGVTFEALIEYEAQERADDIVVKTDRRICVEDGRILYDGLDDTNGQGRMFKDWAEALILHPEWAEAENKLNS